MHQKQNKEIIKNFSNQKVVYKPTDEKKSLDDDEQEPADEANMRRLVERVGDKMVKTARLDNKYVKNMKQYRRNVRRIELMSRQQLSNTMLHMSSFGMEYLDGNCN